MFNIILGFGILSGYRYLEVQTKLDEDSSKIKNMFIILVFASFMTIKGIENLLQIKTLVLLFYFIPIYLFIFSQFVNLNFIELGNKLSSSIFLLLVIGKLGCYFNNCCIGHASTKFSVPLIEGFLYLCVFAYNRIKPNFFNSLIWIILIRYFIDYFRADVYYITPYLSSRQLLLLPIATILFIMTNFDIMNYYFSKNKIWGDNILKNNQ